MNELAAALLQRIRPLRIDGEPELAELVDLQARLAEQFAHARAEWPEVVVDDADVLALAAERLTADGPPAPHKLADQVSALRLADLYIATACATGEPVALRAFETRFFPRLGVVLARFGGEPVADEVRQILREKLFVTTPERRARILDLAGKSDLAGLVRVAAVRTALNLQRSTRHVEIVEADLLLDSLALDPDLERRLDRELTGEVKRAFQDTLVELTPRERNILRMSVLHQLSIDVIGRVHSVHRATAARWLGDIRAKLRHGTRERLEQRLAADPGEVDSLIRLVQSQLDLSFERILDADQRASLGSPSSAK